MDIDFFLDYSDFLYLTNDILMHPEFLKLKNITHHGLTRYDHSIRVAKLSYKITKFLHLDYKKTVRAALLHDFFLEENDNVDIIKRVKTLLKHPNYALLKSSNYFELTDLEKDIIKSHMFPIGGSLPKYLESWIVDFVDDFIAVYEKFYGMRRQISFATSFLFLLMINRFK